MVCFGQAVVGPPGSGKTTYCHGMASFLRACGRDAAIVNLDPANDKLPYTADINIFDLISVQVGRALACVPQLDPDPFTTLFAAQQEVMEAHGLGPNGGLVYCMEYIEKNLDWLIEKLDGLGRSKYILFDFPGQVRRSPTPPDQPLT